MAKRFNRTKLQISALLSAVALAVAAPLLSANAQPPSAAVERARTLVSEGKYPEALAAAREAERNDPNDYRAKYYVAMALYGLGQYPEAAAAAEAALSLSPESSKPTIQALIDRIAATQTSDGAYAEAEAAIAEGLFGKAARLYEEAWIADQSRYDAGLRAAEIYGDRLQEPLKAAKIARAIANSNAPAVPVQQARDLLARHKSQLDEIARKEIKNARAAADWATAKAHLDLALEANPDSVDAQLAYFELAMNADDFPSLEKATKALARANRLNYEYLLMQPKIPAFSQREDFLQLVAETLGDSASARMRTEFNPENRFKALREYSANRKLAWMKFSYFLPVDAHSPGHDLGYGLEKMTIESPCQFSFDLRQIPIWSRYGYQQIPVNAWTPTTITINPAKDFSEVTDAGYWRNGRSGHKNDRIIRFKETRSRKMRVTENLVLFEVYEEDNYKVHRTLIDLRQAMEECPKSKKRR